MSETNEAVTLSPEEELAQAFHLPEGQEDVAQSAQVEVEEEIIPEPEAPAAQAVAPVTETPQTPAFTPITFSHNGQEVTLSSLDEVREYASKGFDYTKKTMAAADEVKAARKFAQIVAQREEQRQAELRAFLADPNRVRQYYEALVQSQGGQVPASATSAPAESEADFEPVSRQELEQFRVQAVQEAQQQAKATIVEALEQVEVQRLQGGYRADFDRTIKGLVTETYPILSDVEGIEKLIKEDGQAFFQAQMDLNPNVPVDPKQVKAVMIESARRRAAKLEARTRVREKETVIRQAALTQRGPEGPGGTAPPAPVARELDLKSDELAQAVLADVQALMGR